MKIKFLNAHRHGDNNYIILFAYSRQLYVVNFEDNGIGGYSFTRTGELDKLEKKELLSLVHDAKNMKNIKYDINKLNRVDVAIRKDRLIYYLEQQTSDYVTHICSYLTYDDIKNTDMLYYSTDYYGNIVKIVGTEEQLKTLIVLDMLS